MRSTGSASDGMTTEWIASLLADPGTRLLALRDLKPLVRGPAKPALDWQPAASWRGQIEAGAP